MQRSSTLKAALTAFIGLAVALAAVTDIEAAVPKTLTLEGVLTSTGGGAAADGVYDMTFGLYAAASGGSATWSEGPIPVAIKGGRFSVALGKVKPLSPTTLNKMSAAWLGVKVANDPELPRTQLRSVAYTLLAEAARSLSCTGCVGGGAIGKGAVGADKVGFPYAGAKTKGGPATVALDLQCTGCVGVSELKIDKDLDLGGNALKAKAVAAATVSATTFQGDGSKLTGIKIPSGECKAAGEVVKGINPDGTLKCVKAMDPKALPADGIDEISNFLIHNQFQNTDCIAKAVPIKDNNPVGVSSELTFGDYGLSQKLDVLIDLKNSDLKFVVVKLWDPANVEYLLWDKSSAGNSLSAVWPSKNKVLKGDLTKWVGKNPKGKWRIQVIDTKFLNNGNDGAVNKFCINIQTLSNKKVKIQGNLLVKDQLKGVTNDTVTVAGGIKLGKGNSPCDSAHYGTLRFDPTWGTQVCTRNTDKSNKITYEWYAARSRPIIWSGGCKQHNRKTGWHTYCLNGVDINTAGDYFSVNGNGTITFKKSGYYRANLWADGYTSSYRQTRFMKNGGQYIYSHHYLPHTGWNASRGDQIWPFKKGDTFYISIHQSSGNNSHYGWHSWNSAGSHSRFQMEFVGPLN